jgi:tRNA nucleotidyltransferase/poly(A) polymerase
MIIRYKTDKKGKSVPVCQIYTQKEHPVRNSQMDKDALWAIRKLHSIGAEAYIVGGAVRDIMLGRVPKDFDIATSASPRQVLRLFWNSRLIGRRFRIVHLFFGPKIIEVTTFRSDEENFEEGNNNIFGTIEQDAKRRDFSINSLYYNPENGQLLDFNHAMEDFRSKTIRSLIPLKYSFSEDPVRMIRAIKYHVVTGFKMRLDVRMSIKRNASNLGSVSISRLTEELNKIIASGNSAEIFTELQHYRLLVSMLPCYSLYIGYPKVLDSLKAMDEKVRQMKTGEGEEVSKAEMILAMISPLVVLQDEYMSPEEQKRDVFRQIKVLISPMTPPNYEVERAAELYLESQGIKVTPRKPKNARKKVAEKGARKTAEEVKPGEQVKKKRRRRKKKAAVTAPVENAEEAPSSAMAHDL